MPESNSEQPTPYEVLGVPEDANIDDVKDAFRRIVRKNHPDISRDGNPYLINPAAEAYDQIRSKQIENKITESFQERQDRYKKERDEMLARAKKEADERLQEARTRVNQVREETSKRVEETRNRVKEQVAAAKKRAQKKNL